MQVTCSHGVRVGPGAETQNAQPGVAQANRWKYNYLLYLTLCFRHYSVLNSFSLTSKCLTVEIAV